MHVLQEVSVACVVLCLMISCTQQTMEGRQHRDNTPSWRQRRTVNMGENNPFQDLVNALQTDGMTNTELYMHYTPSTPAPQNINCYVEIPTTVRQGGQCVQLGVGGRWGRGSRDRPWACQAGIHLALSSHCQNLQGRAGRAGRG